MKIGKYKISNFNGIIIFSVLLVFVVLFYFSIPNIHDKHEVQKYLNKEIDKLYSLNLSLSPEITYSILPKPHYIVKNSKIFFKSKKNNLEFGEAKKINIYIGSKFNLDLNKIKIKKIVVNDSNLRLDKENFENFKDIIESKLSNEINFSKSKLYIKENKNLDTILNLILFDQIKINYDSENDNNILAGNGKLFNQKFNFVWKKYFKNNETKINLDLKSFNLNIDNIIKNNQQKETLTKIKLYRSNLISLTKYDDKEKKLNIKSLKSNVNYSDIKYEINLDLEPIFFESKVELEKLNINKFLKNSIILEQIIKNFIFNNSHINGKIDLKVKEIQNSKPINNLNLKLNFKNKKFNLDKSNFYLSKNMGNFVINHSNFDLVNNELIFRGSIDMFVKDQSSFYRAFLTPKNKRIKLKNVYFDINYNLTTNEIFILNPRLNDSKKLILEKKSGNLDKWIDVKNYVNLLFASYEG